MIARSALLLAALSLLGTAVYAEDPFDLGGIQITLGMPEEAAVKALSDKFSVLSVGAREDGDWLVLEKQGNGGRIGGFRCRQGKIFSVSRDWIESNAEDAKRLADRLFSVLANIAGKEGASARIYAHEVRSPDSNAREIQIFFPSGAPAGMVRRVWVTLTDTHGVSVGEAFESESKGKLP